MKPKALLLACSILVTAVLCAIFTTAVVCNQRYVCDNNMRMDDCSKMRFADLSAACIIVIKQTETKHLTIFATKPVKPREALVGGYTIEMIVSPQMINKGHEKFSGTYYAYHNRMIFRFAAVQLIDGDKALGLRLVQLLADADPEFEWSAPHMKNRTIQEILDGIEKNDGKIHAVLNYEQNQWKGSEMIYGKPEISKGKGG